MFFKNKKNILITLFFTIFLFFFVIATFFDLKIAKQIDNKFSSNNVILFFEKFPLYLFLIPVFLISGSYLSKLLFNLNLKKIKKYIYMTSLFLLFSIFLVIFLLIFYKKIIDINDKWYFSLTFIFIEICFTLIYLKLMNLIKNNNIDEVIYFVKCANLWIIFIFLNGLNLLIFKYIFGRNRPYMVLYENKNFQYPFQINFNRSIDSVSFPSGHTISVGQLIGIIYFFNFKNNLKEKIFKYIILFIVISLTLWVAITRLLLGKHFLTDVSFSMFLIVLYYWLTIKIVKRITRRKY